jgi:hypothetical protein
MVAGLLVTLLAVSAVRAAETVQAVAVPAESPAVVVWTPELVEAHQAYRLAQLRWQQYRFVELPQQRQLLDSRVRMSESEIRVLRRRLRDYRPFLQVGSYSPARTAAENDRLALQAMELQLRSLRNERIALMRYSRQTSQLYQLDVLQTALRVKQALASTRSL